MSDITPEMMRTLGSLEKGQEAILTLLTKQDQRIDTHSSRLEALATRVRSLENQRAYLIGASGVLGFLLSNLDKLKGFIH